MYGFVCLYVCVRVCSCYYGYQFTTCVNIMGVSSCMCVCVGVCTCIRVHLNQCK